MFFSLIEPCEKEKIEDGTCDLFNNWDVCNFDGGDCECYGAGNSFCEPEFNIEKCNWDGGDCCAVDNAWVQMYISDYYYDEFDIDTTDNNWWSLFVCLDLGNIHCFAPIVRDVSNI
jgi:hypothetical protein